MTLFENIDLAKKFSDGKAGLVESQESQQLDKTSLALDVAKRLSESKPKEDAPVQMTAMPPAS